ncbi:MAG: hypothetical protein ISS33_02300 [Candidatus Omnitrophica bacterium]|nr:hypothetical protein [Candidatus Omnitrophota bacterium]
MGFAVADFLQDLSLSGKKKEREVDIHNKLTGRKIIAFCSTLFLILSSITNPAYSFYPAINFLPMQKGMCYAVWEKNQFASHYSDESLKKLTSLGVEYVSICPTHYQEKHNSKKIYKTERTSSKKSLIHVITTARALDLKIMLKPHLDLIDKFDGTYWRADIGFRCEEDWKEWFRSYKKMILDYAALSERMNVEIFCIGTELSFASTKSSYWEELIDEIRNIYGGKLVYASNWDNYKNITFWDKLDYAGIDAYFPLTHKTNPSLEDLKNGWRGWKQEIKTWHAKTNKPILFTEIGYPSTSHAASAPWQNPTGGNADPKIQANCYKAFFETVWNEKWLAGVYWWKWDTNTRAGGENNRHFTPQNKSAQNVIEEHYKTSER